MDISEVVIRLGHTLRDLHNSSDDTQPHSIQHLFQFLTIILILYFGCKALLSSERKKCSAIIIISIIIILILIKVKKVTSTDLIFSFLRKIYTSAKACGEIDSFGKVFLVSLSSFLILLLQFPEEFVN